MSADVKADEGVAHTAGRPCRYCAEGWKLIGGDHWVVRNLSSIAIKPCAAKARGAAQ